LGNLDTQTCYRGFNMKVFEPSICPLLVCYVFLGKTFP